jgi:hypothetical protein
MPCRAGPSLRLRHGLQAEGLEVGNKATFFSPRRVKVEAVGSTDTAKADANVVEFYVLLLYSGYRDKLSWVPSLSSNLLQPCIGWTRTLQRSKRDLCVFAGFDPQQRQLVNDEGAKGSLRFAGGEAVVSSLCMYVQYILLGYGFSRTSKSIPTTTYRTILLILMSRQKTTVWNIRSIPFRADLMDGLGISDPAPESLCESKNGRL